MGSGVLGYFSNAFHRQRFKGASTPVEDIPLFAGDSLFVEVYPSSGRSFVWRHRFPPGKEGKLRDHQIGPYAKRPEQWTIKEAREERALKAEQRQTIQRTGTVTFQKAAEEWVASTSSKLAATTLKDYKTKWENQILPVFGKRSIRAITRSECLDFKRTIEARGHETSPTRCLKI